MLIGTLILTGVTGFTFDKPIISGYCMEINKPALKITMGRQGQATVRAMPGPSEERNLAMSIPLTKPIAAALRLLIRQLKDQTKPWLYRFSNTEHDSECKHVKEEEAVCPLSSVLCPCCTTEVRTSSDRPT